MSEATNRVAILNLLTTHILADVGVDDQAFATRLVRVAVPSDRTLLVITLVQRLFYSMLARNSSRQARRNSIRSAYIVHKKKYKRKKHPSRIR